VGPLFRMGKGYISTDLLRDRETAGRYLTIDRWESRSAFLSFKKISISEYKSLDDKCASLTTNEALLGEFEG
jgi:heme-degrading monooxygenase HmoA